MTREDPQLKLRLNPEMKARITDAARANGRSVNAEIVARLDASFDAGRADKALENLEKSLQDLKASVERAVQRRLIE